MENESKLHETVKQQIKAICKQLGLNAVEEYRGKDWRADILVEHDNIKYAFEVQTTPQSLKRTLERQEKYIRDNIVGCWLFIKSPSKQINERQDLPLFTIKEINEEIYISLKGKKILPLDTFIHDFLYGKIKFCHTMNILPQIEIRFLEFECWKCHALNHIYYIAPFKSPCNTKIDYREYYDNMWDSNKLAMNPEIIKYVREYTKTPKGQHLVIGEIKNRNSYTAERDYKSFGCAKCDALFGDFYIMDTILNSLCNENKYVVDKIILDIKPDIDLRQNIPHWCHPGEHDFCE